MTPLFGVKTLQRAMVLQRRDPIAQNMQGWVAEKNTYQGLPSATGTDVIGHYTQMVWKSTTDVGCATATGNNYDVLVCRYNPPGNSGKGYRY